MRTLPTVFELLRGGVQLNKQLREVRVEDVLGRDPIVRELDRVGAYLRDRIVLVTGAGGSIGSELCRQIAQVKPRLLVMLDHAEDNLFQIDREMVEERHCSNVESVLADCKEPGRMLEAMQRFKTERRLPRRRLQARAADGGQPAGGGPQQRDRDADHGGDGGGLEGRALRPDLDRQGLQPEDGDGRLEGDGRVDRRGGRPQAPGDPLRLRAVRQRARLLGQRRADLPQRRSSAAGRSRSPTRR